LLYRIPVGFLISLLLIYVWINLLENPDPNIVPYYPLAVIIFGVCAYVLLFLQNALLLFPLLYTIHSWACYPSVLLW